MTLETLQNILKDKKFWLFIAIFIFIAVLGIISFLATRPTKAPGGTGIEPELRPTKPDVRVLRVEPLPDQKGISTSPTIKISFEKSIEGKKIAVSSAPGAEFNQKLSSKGFYLTLIPQALLKPSTRYTIAVLEGTTKIYSWSFTTGKKGTDPNVLEKIKSKLPYEAEHLRITYTSATDKFFVRIDAKPVEKYKKDALSWFASQGLPDAEKKINIFYYLVGDAADK